MSDMKTTNNTNLIDMNDALATMRAMTGSADDMTDRIDAIRATIDSRAVHAPETDGPFDPLACLFGYTPATATDAELAQLEELREARAIARNRETEAAKCRKCGGSGHLDSYRHIKGGVCFRCDGTGWRHAG